MRNPLSSFERSMVDFQIVRNSEIISTNKGLKNTETGSNRKYISFYPTVDIQVGDILINPNSPVKYFIVDLDTATWMGEICQLKAYYQTTPPTEQSLNPTVYNINNASNSIIGNQQSAIINNSSFNIDDLKELIELYGAEDKQQLYELVSVLQQSLKEDTFHKSKLSKFSDLIAKHSWLPLSIAQIISGFLK